MAASAACFPRTGAVSTRQEPEWSAEYNKGRFSERGARLARRDEGAARQAVTEEATQSRRTLRQETRYLATLMVCISVKPSSPQGPFSTPMPDHLAPPKGACGSTLRC